MRSTLLVVGAIACGKGAITEMLVDKGYESLSASSFVHREAKRHGLPLPVTRDMYKETTYALRRAFGNDYFGHCFSEAIKELHLQGKGEKLVIDGIRHPDEAMVIKNNFSAKVLGVYANDEIRLQRYLARRKDMDVLTPEGFYFVDKIDRGLDQPSYGHNIDGCLALADQTVENNLSAAMIGLGLEGQARQIEGQRWFSKYRRL